MLSRSSRMNCSSQFSAPPLPEMDLFTYNDAHRVWICRPCGYAVLISHLQSHLATRHRKHPSAATPALRVPAQALMGRRPAWDPTQGACVPPPPQSAPVPGLPVYQGYRCPRCPYVARALSNLPKHQRQADPDKRHFEILNRAYLRGTSQWLVRASAGA
ncbi:hypothetical protein Asppvi_007852 [Aspergillus pseudoviridinutans]|uniref:C2H2-type domain-containing protein n=1 Tax=Aspergillus pseudoviridinutans TaxID=1517512 RepID=A0A9P3BF48_9EURO|nr:uncharacterized protein Asppvi_007852 [Aspergillus pseudoviridinutans]GIJ88924.1 hypothetical protein Asppvi_007852 [Aspergillus pseudoviridinutans]